MPLTGYGHVRSASDVTFAAPGIVQAYPCQGKIEALHEGLRLDQPSAAGFILLWLQVLAIR